MAYRKRYGRRRVVGGRKRRIYRRRRYVSRVRRQPKLHVEFKVESITLTHTLSSAGVFTLLNSIDQGIAVNQRIGNTYWTRSLQLHFTISRSLAATTNFDQVQVNLLYDKEPNNVTPTASEFQSAVGPFGFRNLNNRSRWVIIKQRNFALDDTAKFTVVFKIYKRFNLRSVCTTTGQSITALREGAFWLYTVTSAAANQPTLDGLSRIRWTDA